MTHRPTNLLLTNSVRRGYFIVLSSSLLLSLLYCPPVDTENNDQIVFRYAGMLLAKGGVPYRDLFDHKPPMIYFLNWLGYWLGTWGPWIIAALFTAGATVFFYHRCRKKQLPFPIILPLLFNLLLRNYFVCHGMGLTREYTAIFLMIAFCVLTGRSRYRHFWLGLLGAATFFMQQEQVLIFLPFFIYAISTDLSTARQFLARSIQAAAGCLVIAGPLLLYFAAHHALIAFWRDAFLFNFEWYAQKLPFNEQFRTIHAALTTSEIGVILLISSTMAVTTLLLQMKQGWRTKQGWLIFVTLLANGLTFLPEFISGKMAENILTFDYYLVSLSTTLPIQVFVVWTVADHPFLRSRISHAVFGFLMCAPMVYAAFQHATHLPNDKWYVRNTPEYQFLGRQPLADYQVYVFAGGNWATVYNDYRILAPSPWIYLHFWKWYPSWDPDQHILMSIGRDLLTHHTRYVIDISNDPSLHLANPAAALWWKTFLQQHYQPLDLGGPPGITLWQLHPDAVNIPYELQH